MYMGGRLRPVLAVALLFSCYHAAESVGARVFDSYAMQGGLMLLTLLVSLPLGYWLGFRGWQAYALEWRPLNVAWLVGGVVMALMAKYVAACLGLAFGIYRPATITFDEVDAAQTAVALASAMLLTFVPSLAEDILTRGFWYRASRIAWRGKVFVPVSAAIFMLNHVYWLGEGALECITLFCFGVAYAVALWRSGSLWLAVGLHWGWNLANSLLDRVLPVEVVDTAHAPLLSAAVHVVLALGLLTIPKSEVHDERQ